MTFTVITLTLALFLLTVLFVFLTRWFYESDKDIETWRGGAAIFSGLIAILLAVAVFAFPITVVSSAIVCRNQAANLELPHRFSISAGCYVKFHGQWIGIDKALGIVAR